VNPKLRLLAAVAFVVLLLLAAELSGLRKNFSLDSLRAVFQMHMLAAIAVFVLLFCMGNLLHVPGLLFLGAAVLALGKLQGGLVTYLAACVSCTLTFLIFRWLGGNALQQIKGRRAQALLATLHQHPVRNVFILRVLMQTLPSLNVALGLSGLRFAPYLLGTVLGLPIPIAAYCIFFDLLARAL
jgi:uncharacterized membrane protein YdjX (TVP38/TMEM64 family)